MQFMSLFLAIGIVASGVHGFPRFLAIPLDRVSIIELSPILPTIHRVPRQTEAYVPVTMATVRAENVAEVETVQRMEPASSGHLFDYVDFGGHTGENGAFGWYADYPAQS